MKCANALLLDDKKYLCGIHGTECLFWIPDSQLCAQVYNEGPDAIDSNEIFKSVEKYIERYSIKEGISIDEARNAPIIKMYIEHFNKILAQHRDYCHNRWNEKGEEGLL